MSDDRGNSTTLYATADRMNASAALKSTTWRSASMVWRVWGAGPPVILLHGGFGSWTHWLRTIPALTGNYTVLVPDMPGFGDSENPALDDHLEAIPCALLSGLETLVDIDHGINVVGFSFGTVMAGQLAKLTNETHPGKLLSLTLIAPAGLGFVTGASDLLMHPRPNMSNAEYREMHRKNLGIVMMSDTSKITDETIDLQIDNTARARISGKPYSRSDALLRACAGLPLPHMDAIWGSKDSYALRNEPDYSVAVNALHPDIRSHHIDGAGHWVQYEQPQQLNTILLDCLENR